MAKKLKVRDLSSEIFLKKHSYNIFKFIFFKPTPGPGKTKQGRCLDFFQWSLRGFHIIMVQEYNTIRLQNEKFIPRGPLEIVWDQFLSSVDPNGFSEVRFQWPENAKTTPTQSIIWKTGLFGGHMLLTLANVLSSALFEHTRLKQNNK